MQMIHVYNELTIEKRPQDPMRNGNGLRFQTLDHGGDLDDDMPQAIRLIDADGRSCVYVPVQVNGRVVDSQGYEFCSEPAELLELPEPLREPALMVAELAP